VVDKLRIPLFLLKEPKFFAKQRISARKESVSFYNLYLVTINETAFFKQTYSSSFSLLNKSFN